VRWRLLRVPEEPMQRLPDAVNYHS
jgi:hypothetical protein